MPIVAISEIDRHNWRAALAMRVQPEQQRFVGDHSPIALLALAKAYVQPGGLIWTPYLFEADERPVGLCVLAHAPEGAGECWLYHFLIDHREQGRGYGRAALRALIALVANQHPGCRAITLTVHPENLAAQHLYTAAGFQATGESIDGEPVMRLPLPAAVSCRAG